MKKIKIEQVNPKKIWWEKNKFGNFCKDIPEFMSCAPYSIEELDKLIAELENVKVKAEDVMKISIQDVSLDGEGIMVPFKDWENGLWEDQRLYGLHHTKRIPDKPIDWGDGDAYVNCRSFADITILNTGPYNEPYETDFYYSTPEVIQVLKQWRDYEEKTVKEELEKEKTKTKKIFVDKLLGK